MNQKYYTPEIEEFHVGFEYEYEDIVESGSSDFFKATIENASEIDDLFDDMYEHGNQIRVKYLDKEDIESLGFDLYQIANDSYEWEWHLQYKGPTIGMFYEDTKINEPNIELFNSHFIIKNKSELKRLLKQLDVF